MTSGYAETIVLFDVEDINDCAPRFANDSYKVTVSEAVPTGTVILKLSASDLDSSGPNSDITFSILKDKTNSSGKIALLFKMISIWRWVILDQKLVWIKISFLDLFEIDPASGDLVLKRSLDRERQKHHHLKVVATDKGAPRPLSSTVQVDIDVLDSNDNTPGNDHNF